MAGRQFVSSTCVQTSITDPTDAATIFGQKDPTGQISLVLIPAARGWFPFVTVPMGCHCLGQSFGQALPEKLTPGASPRPPWFRIAYMVTMQASTYNHTVKECPTSDNVRVSINCQMSFSIQDPNDFVYKLGAVQFDQMLKGAVHEAIRLMVRRTPHTQIRALRGSNQQEMLGSLNEKFSGNGVGFNACTIVGVTLPAALESSLEEVTKMDQEKKYMQKTQESDIRKLKQSFELELEKKDNKHESDVVREEGRRKETELKHRKELVQVEQAMHVQTTQGREDAQVKQLELKAQLERTKVDMEKRRVQQMSQVETQCDARRISADNLYFKQQSEADAERERLLGEVERIKNDADAEAQASLHLTHKRKHELDMKEKAVIMKLAQKAQFNLIGTSGDCLVDAVMTGHLDAEKSKSGGWFK